MRNRTRQLMCATIVLLCAGCPAPAEDLLQLRDLFNGKDLSGWVNVNTAADTWTVRDGILVCSGEPIGVLRTDRQYENFILQLEWKHLEAGGNSGVFVWCEGSVPEGKRLPKGVEVQILELEWAVQNNQTDAYVHGEIFGRGSGQTQVERRAFARRALDIHESAVAAQDAQHIGESQAGALARGFGREERLEYLHAHRFGHAAAGVGDRYQHILARPALLIGGQFHRRGQPRIARGCRSQRHSERRDRASVDPQ